MSDGKNPSDFVGSATPIRGAQPRALFSSPLLGKFLAQNSPGFDSRLARDAFHYFLSKAIPGLMGFLSVLVFVRMLGVERYGRYAVTFTLVTACASGFSGWLAQGVLRFQSQAAGGAETEIFLRSVIRGTFVSVVLGEAALAIALWVFGVKLGWSSLLSAVLFGALLLYTVTLARFQAGLQSAKVMHAETLRAVAAFLIPVILMAITHSRDYRLLLLGIAAAYLLALSGPLRILITTLTLRGNSVTRHATGPERKILQDLWRFGWPVAAWLLCQQCLLVSDRFFLQKFSGYSDAGVYASLYDAIVRSFSLVFMPVTLALHPLVISRWNGGGRRLALQTIRGGVKYQFLLFLPVVTVMVALAPWIARVVLGGIHPGAAFLVLPLALGGFLWQVALLAHKPLEILCRTQRMLYAMLFALAINVTGNWLLVPKFGYRAAAILTVASSAAYLASVFLMTPMRELRAAIAAESVPALAILPASPDFAASPS